jgi:hypothetical protein
MGRLTDRVLEPKQSTDTKVEMQDPINMPALIQKIADVLTVDRWQSKGNNVSHENVLGMIQANNFNNFIVESLGAEFRIVLLDKLILDKMTFVQSVGGIGVRNVKEGLNSLQPVVSSVMPPTFIETLAQNNNLRGIRKE